MASLNSKIIRLKAKEFNKLRQKKLPNGITYYLLTKTGRTNSFTWEFTVKDCYHLYDKYREQTKMMVATEDIAFANAIHIASDVAIGGYVYEIAKRDVSPPDGNRPWWEVFCTKSGQIYTLP